VPFIRFSRDKRGYESTYVMHAGTRRAQRPQVLYWFRTPPNVKVGRSALDEEAIRQIEENNPDLAFDWPRMLKAHVVPLPPDERPGPHRRDRRPSGRPRSPAQGGAGAERRFSSAGPQAPPRRAEPAVSPVHEPAPPADDVEAATPQDVSSVEPFGRETEGGETPVSPVDRLVGAEGLERLRARYAELLARISERVADAARREVLRAEAEKLDPDTWVTVDEARAGVEGFEAAYLALRTQLGRKRRRRGGRRQGRPGGDSEAAGPGSSGDAAPSSSESAEDEGVEPDGEPDSEV
jgi:hypothetical protein